MAIATTPPAASPDHTAWRAEVDSSPTPVTVTALLVVQDPNDPRLADTLGALSRQVQRPERLVVIDATPERAIRAAIDAGAGDVGDADAPWRTVFPDLSVVVVPPGSPFAEIVDTAVDALPGPGEDLVVTRRPRERARQRTVRVRDKREWFWLLHEDSAPSPGALRALMREAARSDRVGIAGCKVVEAARPTHLINVGLGLTRTGRHVGAHVEGEPDQGQHDERRDVLSVSSAGMLIRRDVYLTLGGFDPAFDGDGDGLDLCWRTHLLGFQVVVIPTARVQQALVEDNADKPGEHRPGRGDVDRPRPRSGRTLRRHRQVALARCSLIALPFAALWVALSSVFVAVVMLLLKRPRRAVAEAAQATAPLGVGKIVSARRRFRGRGETRRRHLEALFIPTSIAIRDAWDAVLVALTPEPDLDSPPRTVSADRRSLTARALTNPGLWLTLALTVAAVVRWRPLLGSGVVRGSADGLSGGQLLPFGTDAEGIWRLWRDHWSGPGLGAMNPEQPFLPVLAFLARVAEILPWVEDSTSGATVVAWVLIGAIPASGLAAYLAGRAATKAPWPRAVAGLVWAGLATVTTASAQGRLGPVVAHILIPLVLAGTLTVARRKAGAPSTFGTVFVAAVLGAFAPLALILTSFIALGVVLLGQGWARGRGALVLVGPWLLLGPWTFVRAVEEPRALLAGPGALTSVSAPEGWQLALAHPGGPGSYVTWWTAPFLALGVLALLVPARGQARAMAGLALAALLGLAAALAAPHITVTALDGVDRMPWAGVPLDVMAAALLGLGLLVVGPTFRRPLVERSAWAHASLAVLLVLTGVGAAAVIGVPAWQQPVRSMAEATPPTPGVAAHLAHGSRATRMLTLNVSESGAVTYRLDGRERGAPARDLDVPRRSDRLIESTVQSILAAGASGDAAVPTQLGQLAVGFIGVTGPGDRTVVTTALAGTDGLSPMASSSANSLWRVQPTSQGESVPVSRLSITRGDELLAAVPMDDPNARTSQSISDGPAGRILQIAEAPGWGWDATVTLNGAALERLPGATPRYALPAQGGQLEVAPATAFPTWRWAQGAALAACVFLAIPFGNARSRRRA
ncbi:glycosyltransferase [Demetria terragena]|uniref:glycosyltransferase n=1 Tax=Demetria terragena TaxID=63959 RepID=UPI0003817127|nr:glycosyltransferase [Demetria terragena]